MAYMNGLVSNQKQQYNKSAKKLVRIDIIFDNSEYYINIEKTRRPCDNV